MICASLALLHPLLSLTHWIFRSLMLPYKSSSHSAKCVRCAPQSGNPPPSAPQALSPPERSEHNPPPTGGHNLRPGGPSTFLVTTLLHNPRRQPRPFFIICGVSRHHHPLNQPAKGRPNPLNPLNPGHRVARQPSHRRCVQWRSRIGVATKGGQFPPTGMV